MAFTIVPLRFLQSGHVLATEPAQGTTRVSGQAAIDDMVRNAEQGFLLGGARGSGKTSLLQEVSLYVTRRLHNMVVLGPLSLGLVASHGLNSLGSELRDWLVNHYSRIPSTLLPVDIPEHSDSLEAWLPFLKKLVRERKADTLLLLLDDLESVQPEERLSLLQYIKNSSWATVGARLVLGCAGTLGDDEISLIPGDHINDTDPAMIGKPSSPEVVEIKLTKSSGVELLNAMIISLGVVPPPGKKSGIKPPRPGIKPPRPGIRPPAPGLPPGPTPGRTGKPKSSSQMDEFLPADKSGGHMDEILPVKPRGQTGLTSGPEPLVALRRYINHKFTKDRTDKSPIDKSFALALDHEVYLRMNIGPFEKDTIIKMEEAQEFPRTEETDKWFPETKGKPLPLEATVFSNDFYVPERERTQKFMLDRDGPTMPLYFPVTPRRKRSSRLRLCVFYRNHLLQSLSIEVDVRKRLGIARSPQRSKMEMSFSADFTRADQLPARGLWLGINQNADDTHTLNIKNSKTALSRNLRETEIAKALKVARDALLEVSFDLVKDDKSKKERKIYRFKSDNSITGTPEQQRERFRKDLTNLAVAGNLLRGAIFDFTPLAEEKETVDTIVDEMKETLDNEQVIQISRLKQMADIWPWALIYDSHIDAKKVKRVCVSYQGASGALPYAEGVKKCDHRDPKTLRNKDHTVVCPYSFWGFKHIIEQPTQPSRERDKAFANLVLEIKLGAEPVFEMMLEAELAKKKESVDHINTMKGRKFRALDTFDEISAAFDPAADPPPREPHILYFFCHGKSDAKQGPYLAVGANESLLPSLLNEWRPRWSNSHGLVFINGCHTAELEPSELSSIMQPFIKAEASGIIGTEISVTTHLAGEFADKFFERFLADDKSKHDNRVGQIIKDVRLNLLMKYNPLGLVYTPYCSADLHVTRPALSPGSTQSESQGKENLWR